MTNKENNYMTAIELIRLLRKVENKGKDVYYDHTCPSGARYGLITDVEEQEDKIIVR